LPALGAMTSAVWVLVWGGPQARRLGGRYLIHVCHCGCVPCRGWSSGRAYFNSDPSANRPARSTRGVCGRCIGGTAERTASANVGTTGQPATAERASLWSDCRANRCWGLCWALAVHDQCRIPCDGRRCSAPTALARPLSNEATALSSAHAAGSTRCCRNSAGPGRRRSQE